ncbi:MAG: hypothetical protein KF762_11760 [Acidobacteria bacterium]|nr:hypothetical protein [Acidobacteriota bacterium]
MKQGIIAIGLLLVFSAYGFGQKTLSARGFFCGQTEPSYVNVHMVVGNSIKVFSIGPDDGLQIRGARNKAFFQLPIGTELIITYKVQSRYGVRGNWIKAASVTGKRNRSVKRCASD